MHKAQTALIILVTLGVAALSLANDKLPLPELNKEHQRELAGFLEKNGLPPVEYVLSKFAEHDVVILGEQHRARQDPLLVQSLIPRLPEVGVFTLCTEFARRADQPLIDSLLSGAEYDQQLANLITLQQFVHWGYVEYVDIFKAAWQYNREKSADARSFRILALGNSAEWWHVKTQEDREKDEIKRKVRHGESEEDWAKVVFEQVIKKDEKALAYCGIHHGFSEYRQPVVVDGKFARYIQDRFGNHLYDAIGKGVITIFMHNIWNNVEGWNAPYVYPADGCIDALMAALGPEAHPVGFDTKGTPFGKLPGANSIYSHGYEDFTLEQFCDGYIFQMPFSEFEPVTCIEGYYHEGNIDYARRNAVNPWFRDKPIEEFESTCEESRQENAERWLRLH